MADERGCSAIHLACEAGDEAVVLELLAANPSSASTRALCLAPPPPYVATTHGWTPLHFAAANGHPSIVSHLCNSADADYVNSSASGWTPLHVACYHGHLGCVQVLISRGASVNEQRRNGKTALHIASKGGNIAYAEKDALAMVTALLSAGADARAQRDDGRTPLFYAVRSGSTSIVQHLLLISEYSAQELSKALRCAKHNELDSISELLQQKGAVNN
jgi:ankyrin repeat protein